MSDSSRVVGEKDAHDQLRLILTSAHKEFKVRPCELTSAAAAGFSSMLALPLVVPPAAPPGVTPSVLRSYEKSVFAALERLLRESSAAGQGTPADPVVLYPTVPCDIRIAVPALRLAIEVGCPEDFFDTAIGRRPPRSDEL